MIIKTQLVGAPLADSRVDRKYSNFHGSFTANRDELIVPFLVKRRELIRKVKKLLHGAAEGTSCLVMCANEGHASLILNFFCNLRSKGACSERRVHKCCAPPLISALCLLGIKVPLHVLFVTTAALQKKFEDLGLVAFFDDVFSKLPAQDAAAYGDGTFAKMMLLKQFSTTLVLEAGMDVLFQVCPSM